MYANPEDYCNAKPKLIQDTPRKTPSVMWPRPDHSTAEDEIRPSFQTEKELIIFTGPYLPPSTLSSSHLLHNKPPFHPTA